MKKHLLLFISSILLLSGCGNLSADSVVNPYELKSGSELLSLYGEKETFGENGFEVFDYESDLIRTPEINGIVAARNDISSINICDENVITYKSISVGDDISKVENAFEYEYQNYDSSYLVLFNDKNEEVDINSIDSQNNDITVTITYLFEDTKIKRIIIGKREPE